MSTQLYASYGLKRVYYSAFSPIPDASAALPPRASPLLREHRLYQADWLLRFYGFALDEMPIGATGNLPLEIDPKLAWALDHREDFPVDVNRAPREILLRIPGLGVKSADRLISGAAPPALAHGRFGAAAAVDCEAGAVYRGGGSYAGQVIG